jgi:hypothetical protein
MLPSLAYIMLIELLIGLACLLAYVYWRLNRKWTTFWPEQGVKIPPTSFPFGNSAILNWHNMLKARSPIDVAREQYIRSVLNDFNRDSY